MIRFGIGHFQFWYVSGESEERIHALKEDGNGIIRLKFRF